MLQLQQTCTGYPAAGVQYLNLSNESLILFPSGDAVIILNARTLALVRVLAFWEAFPGTSHSKDAISCISVDSGMKLIVAACKSRLAAWSLSGIHQDSWRIHSTLVLPEQHHITVLDNKAGLLAVGCEKELSVYTLVLENDLPTWSKKWTASTITPILLNFAPSLMFISAVSKEHNAIRLYSTTTGRQTQLIPHPRPILKVSWRRPQASSRDDLIMYTVTSDATIRIFFPVLDAPDRLQLHAALDLYSSLPFSVVEMLGSSASAVFWLDRQSVHSVINHILKDSTLSDDARTRRIKEIRDEGWDLFLRVLSDGSIVVTAVANIDRRPPTLLQQFTLQQSQPSIFSKPPEYLYILPNPDSNLLTLVTTPPLMSMDLSPLSFFDARSDGLKIHSAGPERIQEEESEIIRFIRTPEGKGVGALRAIGGEVWKVTERGKKIVRSSAWDKADFVVVLDYGMSIFTHFLIRLLMKPIGRQFLTYTKEDSLVKLHSKPPQTLSIPNLESLFTMPSHTGYEHILGVTSDFTIVQLKATSEPSPSLTLIHSHKLPLSYTPRFILPVDPMAWGKAHDWTTHDVLLSISEEGVIAFWVPEAKGRDGWKKTSEVRTGRKGFRKVRCSSAKKTALIVDGPDGDELTIWDSTESEFSSGLEYTGNVSEIILDLDWSSTPDMQSILAVGYAHRVDILCQQRMTYFSEGPGWGLCRTIDISSFTPYPISDSIWLAHGSFLIAAGQQMYLFSEPQIKPEDEANAPESLMEYVARQNGPLDDYHPQMLLQCMIWDKVELVKETITNLAKFLFAENDTPGTLFLPHLPVERYLQKEQSMRTTRINHKRYNSLFNGIPVPDNPDEIIFARPTIERLIQVLEHQSLPNLSQNEQAHLIVLIQTALEIDEQRRALDSNGLRYLISMRSFYIINQRASTPAATPATNGASMNNVTAPKQSARRERLRYRDMIWAFHSESQDLLLSASTAACDGKMTWPDARALGVSIWLTSLEALKTQFEVIARNEYMAGDNRDPTRCSVFYFALGKSKLVHGLWRQAAWHKEQNAMLKFLANDFTTERWRRAALKNAFALLSKQRFEYAAAFFLLGGSLKDAVNVCLRQLDDFQLAVALARIVEQGNDGPVLKEILTSAVLPIASKLGNRWLGSWAFWLLHRRDLAVRILLTPLQDIASAANIQVSEIGHSNFDDTGLALLFSQLRSKTLQTAKGTSEISGRAEFNFVLQMARVFCRMGCHVLALDLIRSWSFARPSIPVRTTSEANGPPLASPTPRFFEPAMLRRTSILIDMDPTSMPPTRISSPAVLNGQQAEQAKEESDKVARKAGIGNLMKTAKHDVQVPEFDMNAFF
ncbi:RAVE protein 1 C terminal-domain-containing protein [Crepidotus variabilis]|uniref:RAVE protein 1 C terminal-domain-containing protein n=1 Tax=Crepidotus variabilis TaxID=179855 RepID=A0A9P6EE47_9AGAR|nr:RAVE protein 1 C terminal-domain-containing protein [Crepidotus variabilis]